METNGLKNIYRSLKYRNYRLFFSGQSISLIGTWMQRIAMPWLVYSLTDSVFLLGLVGFAGQIPVFLLSPFAGVYVDRWNRYYILIITQILASVIDAPNTLIIGGISCVLWAIVFVRKLPELRKLVHPIYSKMGIISEENVVIQKVAASTNFNESK